MLNMYHLFDGLSRLLTYLKFNFIGVYYKNIFLLTQIYYNNYMFSWSQRPGR